jgi:hypothetical protein
MYLEFEREIRRIGISVNTKYYLYDSSNVREKEATKSTRGRRSLRTSLVLLIW